MLLPIADEQVIDLGIAEMLKTLTDVMAQGLNNTARIGGGETYGEYTGGDTCLQAVDSILEYYTVLLRCPEYLRSEDVARGIGLGSREVLGSKNLVEKGIELGNFTAKCLHLGSVGTGNHGTPYAIATDIIQEIQGAGIEVELHLRLELIQQAGNLLPHGDRGDEGLINGGEGAALDNLRQIRDGDVQLLPYPLPEPGVLVFCIN